MSFTLVSGKHVVAFLLKLLIFNEDFPQNFEVMNTSILAQVGVKVQNSRHYGISS